MRKAFLPPLMAVAMALAGIAFWAGRAPGVVTLQFLRARPVADGVSITFAISNRTGQIYSFYPLRLEAWDGSNWAAVPEGIWAAPEQDDPAAGACIPRLSCFTKRLPAGRMRLIAQSAKAQCGLASYPIRVKLRLLNWRSGSSLNPFDTNMVFGTGSGEVISAEFCGPD
jgi:hypothetical protein